MEIALNYSGTPEHPSKVRNIAQRLREIEAELIADGLTGTLEIEESDRPTKTEEIQSP